MHSGREHTFWIYTLHTYSSFNIVCCNAALLLRGMCEPLPHKMEREQLTWSTSLF